MKKSLGKKMLAEEERLKKLLEEREAMLFRLYKKATGI